MGFCTFMCLCFPTKMLHLNAPFLPLKCSVSPQKRHWNARIMLIIQTFFLKLILTFLTWCAHGVSHASRSQRKHTRPPRLLKRKTADFSSVSTQIYEGDILRFCEFWVLVFIFPKKIISLLVSKKNISNKVLRKCSNNAQCFCPTKMLEKC